MKHNIKQHSQFWSLVQRSIHSYYNYRYYVRYVCVYILCTSVLFSLSLSLFLHRSLSLTHTICPISVFSLISCVNFIRNNIPSVIHWNLNCITWKCNFRKLHMRIFLTGNELMSVVWKINFARIERRAKTNRIKFWILSYMLT